MKAFHFEEVRDKACAHPAEWHRERTNRLTADHDQSKPAEDQHARKSTINAGIFTYATQYPCQAPIKPPTIRQSRIVNAQFHPHLTIMTPAIAPTKAATEPTERSIQPETMISSMPNAMIMT